MQEALGGPEVCLVNEVPGEWLDQPALHGMQFNEWPDFEAEKVAFCPRMGGFEVYANVGFPQG